MFVGERYPIKSVFILSVIVSAICIREDLNERKTRHLFPFLGYLHGYKIGQHYASQLTPYLFAPIVIVPYVNQQQSVNIQKSSADESYQEMGGTFQNILPAKIILDPALLNVPLIEMFKMDQDDIILNASEDTLRQYNESDIMTSTVEINSYVDEYDTNTTPSVDTTIKVSTEDKNNLTLTYDQESLMHSNISENFGPYPSASYNNGNISNIVLTNKIPSGLTLPSSENNWKNYSTYLKNESSISLDTNNRYENSNNFTKNNGGHSYANSQFSGHGHVYPSAWYNAMVDRISLTTRSYSSEDSSLQSPYNDGLDRFPPSSKTNPTSGFRPLAGLYYDGFLHKSVNKKTGFVPYNTNLIN